MWNVSTSHEFDSWFKALPTTPEGREALIEIAASVELLKQIGPTLGRPTVDTLNGSAYSNMKELRAKTGVMVVRIAFAFDPMQKAILLIGGDKSGVSSKRFYQQLITRADRIYGAHLAAVKREVAAKAEKAKATANRRRR